MIHNVIARSSLAKAGRFLFALWGFAMLLSLSLAVSASADAGNAPSPTKDRVIVIGLDGTRPDYLMQAIEAGKLPNLAGLALNGLTGTILPPLPPPSPVSWATFETGMNPGKHGIFGFFNIPSGTYTMTVTFTSNSRPLWERLSDAGKTGIVVNLFSMGPAAPIKGIVIPGMGTPSTIAPYRVLSTSKVEGNYAPLTLKEAEGWENVPESHSPPLEAEIGGDTPGYLLLLDTVDEGITAYDEVLFAQAKNAAAQRVKLEKGQLSPVFDTKTSQGTSGLFYLALLENTVEAADYGTLTVYVSPVSANIGNFVSDSAFLIEAVGQDLIRRYVPDAPFSPADLLPGGYGLFVQQLYEVERVRSEVVQKLLAATDWDYLIVNLTGTDRIQHVLWHATDPRHPMYTEELNKQYGEVFERYYEFMDAEVGKILAAARPDDKTTVIIMSDHGFGPIYRALSVNEFLRREGLLTVKKEAEGKPIIRVPDDIDWTKTKAVAYDFDPQIRINLKGRDPQGIVEPGEEYEALKALLVAKLEALTDPKNGERIVSRVYDQYQVYQGPLAAKAGDLRVAFRPAYSALDTRGTFAPGRLIIDVTTGWSGSHDGEPEDYRGVLIMSGPKVTPIHGYSKVRMEDLAPTIMRLLNVTPPADWPVDGRVLDAVRD